MRSEHLKMTLILDLMRVILCLDLHTMDRLHRRSRSSFITTRTFTLELHSCRHAPSRLDLVILDLARLRHLMDGQLIGVHAVIV